MMYIFLEFIIYIFVVSGISLKSRSTFVDKCKQSRHYLLKNNVLVQDIVKYYVGIQLL